MRKTNFFQNGGKKEKQGEKTNIDNTKTRKNRGVVWQDDATNFLIDVWGEEVIQLQLENCKTSKQTSKVYEALLVSGYELYYLALYKSREKMTELAQFGKFRNSKFQISKFPKFQVTVLAHFSKFPNFQNSEFPNFQFSKIPIFQIPKFQNSEIPNFPNSVLGRFSKPQRFPNFQIPFWADFPNSEIPKFPLSKH